MSNNSSSVRFTLNFADKTIVGTKASFAKASKGFGPVYDELAALMAKHPTYRCVEKAPKKPAKEKRSYVGMDIPFIIDFFHAIDMEEDAAKLEKALAYAEANRISKYPLAKRMLFDVCPDFDYASAKQEVAEYRHRLTLTKADEMAAKKAALAA